MSAWTSWRLVTRRHPRLADAALAAALFASTLGMSQGGPAGEFVVNAQSVAVGAVICGVLALRRRWPLFVLVVTVAGLAALIVIAEAKTPYIAVVAVAAYTVASTTDRRTAWTAGAVTAFVLATTAIVTAPGPWLSPQNLGFVAWTGMATAIGDGVRTRRAYIAEVEERARRAEQTREEEAGRRVTEERLRIARELHDVVAHHIALINVQAGVAGHLLRAQPDVAADALGHIRQAGRTVLDELGTLLMVLREAGDQTAPPEPAPGLSRLDGLLDRFATVGMKVELSISGRPRPLPASVDLAAYRIVQESLTNAHKHGTGSRARVSLVHGADALRIEIHNDSLGGVKPRDRGNGIVGMSERALSLGGTLHAGPEPGDGFTVTAMLPLPERDYGEHDPGTAGG